MMQSPVLIAASAVAAVAILLSLGHQSSALFELQDTACGLEYQTVLTEAIEMRKQCNNAAFRDCCQVHRISMKYCTYSIYA